MGLFDKKYCDICGEKIGLLGNRKLEDGNLCKNCAAKLSPFFSERRRSTVEDIKRQLAYREENEKLVRNFNPDVMFDGSKKVYISTVSEAFIVTGSSNWRSANPDIIKLSQVVAVDTNIKKTGKRYSSRIPTETERAISRPAMSATMSSMWLSA